MNHEALTPMRMPSTRASLIRAARAEHAAIVAQARPLACGTLELTLERTTWHTK